MGTIFSETLILARKSSGFKTAYKFYYGNGGEAALGMTYRQYLLIEQGKSLPPFERFRILLHALRLIPNAGPANELVISWLKTMAGQPAFAEILAPLLYLKENFPGKSPLEDAVGRSLTAKRTFITPKQLEVIAENYSTYLCYLLVSKDSGTWTDKDIAERLGIEREETRRGLNSLVTAKLLRRTAAGKFKCTDAAMMRDLPQSNINLGLFTKLREYQDKALKSGKQMFSMRGFVRADVVDFYNYFHLMRSSLSSAEAYNITEGTQKSAIFCVEGKVTKLMDF
ncbi:MAG: hypothetical protein HY952_12370 [Elusimicrobia bacterium]|nr:hypothetical protein [Elusimicrobiota bacterium]